MKYIDKIKEYCKKINIEYIECEEIQIDVYKLLYFGIIKNYDEPNIYDFYLGVHYGQQGNADLMIQSLEKLDHPYAHNALAIYYEEIGDYDLAEEHYMIGVNDRVVQYNYGLFCHLIKDHETMVKLYEKSLENGYMKPINNLVRYYEKQNDLDNMFRVLTIGLTNCDDESIVTLFNIYKKENIDNFDMFFEMYAFNFKWHKVLGEIALDCGLFNEKKKDYDNSIKYYEYSFNLFNNLDAITNLSKLYNDIGKDDKLIETLLKGAEKCSDFYNDLAIYYKNQNDYDNFYKYMMIAIDNFDIEKSSSICYYNLSVYYLKKEFYNYDKFIEYTLKGVSIGNQKCMYNLVIHYYKTNCYDEMTDIILSMMDTDIESSIDVYKQFYSIMTKHNDEYNDYVL